MMRALILSKDYFLQRYPAAVSKKATGNYIVSGMPFPVRAFVMSWFRIQNCNELQASTLRRSP